MWIARTRFERDKKIVVVSALIGGIFAFSAMYSGDPRYLAPGMIICSAPMFLLATLMRCSGCRRSATWWGARHIRKADFLGAIAAIEACPYCGHREE